MIPNTNLNPLTVVNEIKYSDTTYKVTEGKIQGHISGLEALKQDVHKRLQIARYHCPLYSFQYGIDLQLLLGKEREYVKAEMKRRITEALKQDSRIQNVSNFIFQASGDEIHCEFTVESVYGGFTMKGGLNGV